MLKNNDKEIVPYRQQTFLKKKYNHCKLVKEPVDINYISFSFDNGANFVSREISYYEGEQFLKKTHLYLYRVTEDSEMDNVTTEDGVVYLHYLSDYVKNNYSHYVNKKTDEESLSKLIGFYFLDWDNCDFIKNHIKGRGINLIEICYFVLK